MNLATLLSRMGIVPIISNLNSSEKKEEILIEVNEKYYNIKDIFFLENGRTVLRIEDNPIEVE